MTSADAQRPRPAGSDRACFDPVGVGRGFDALADSHHAARRAGVANEVDRVLANWIREIALSRVGHAADLGAGSGIDAEVLLEHGWVVDAVDVSAAMIAHATSRLAGFPRARLHHKDAQLFLETSDEQFDLVLAVGETLCYASSPDLLVEATASRLAPGGIVIGSILELHQVRERGLETGEGDVVLERRDPPLWIRALSGASVRSMFAGHGLRVSAWYQDGGLRAAFMAEKAGRSEPSEMRRQHTTSWG